MRIIAIIFIIFLFSCSAEKKLNKIYLNKPELVADKARLWFPCVSTTADTTVKIVDSLIYIECPEIKEETETKQKYIIVKDTFTKTIKVPYQLPIKYVYIKQKIEDSAKVFVRDQIIEDKTDKLEKTKDQIVRKNNFNWILICICIVLLFLNILQWKKK